MILLMQFLIRSKRNEKLRQKRFAITKKGAQFIMIWCLLLFVSCGLRSAQEDTPFTFKETAQGVELLENEKPVFFYQRQPKSLTGEYNCNNYLHPLYSIEGDTLTEEFPEDHPYHRGIFWSWHQVFIDTQSIGDHWIMKNIAQEVSRLTTVQHDGKAILKTKVNWTSPSYMNQKPFIEEQATITAYTAEDGLRKIDFEIALKALVPGVQIGGSDDAKGYGGFCARLRMPDNLLFTAEAGKVIPQELQLNAGPWMDFTADFDKNNEHSGITILCHNSTPNYPAPWILRQKGSMQNIVYPGRNRVALSATTPLVLRYRLIVHNGKAGALQLNTLQAEYQKQQYQGE